MKCLENLKPIVALLVVHFIWGITNVLFKKVLSEGVNNLVIITYRQSLSVLLLIPIAYFLERKSLSALTFKVILALFFNGILGPTLTTYFVLIGLNYTSATYSTAYGNIVPVITFILALCFRLEKLNVKNKSGIAKVVGTIICVGGSLLLVLYKGMSIINPHASLKASHHHKAKEWAIGSTFLMLANLTWSSWFLIQTRIGKMYPFPYTSTAIMFFFSAIQAALLSLIVHRDFSIWVLKGPIQISSILFAGLFGSGICYVVMCWCIKIKGPVFTSAFTPFIQIFAAIFDASLFHQQIFLGSILGSIVVVVGMYLLLWGKSSEGAEIGKQMKLEENDEDGKLDSKVLFPVIDHPLKALKPVEP